MTYVIIIMDIAIIAAFNLGCLIWYLNRPPKPKIDEIWKIKDKDGSPWPNSYSAYSKILDVKDGWVRYHINEIYPDNRMKISSFVSGHQKVFK